MSKFSANKKLAQFPHCSTWGGLYISKLLSQLRYKKWDVLYNFDIFCYRHIRPLSNKRCLISHKNKLSHDLDTPNLIQEINLGQHDHCLHTDMTINICLPHSLEVLSKFIVPVSYNILFKIVSQC